jgi:hypothetical protein
MCHTACGEPGTTSHRAGQACSLLSHGCICNQLWDLLSTFPPQGLAQHLPLSGSLSWARAPPLPYFTNRTNLEVFPDMGPALGKQSVSNLLGRGPVCRRGPLGFGPRFLMRYVEIAHIVFNLCCS